MLRNKRRKKNWILTFGFTLACCICIFYMLVQSVEVNESRQLETLKSAVIQAAVSCYATEGVYPPSLEYLTQYYGIHVDEEKYLVTYDAFATNIMPEITVRKKGETG